MSEKKENFTDLNPDNKTSYSSDLSRELVAQVREAIGLPAKPDDYSLSDDLFQDSDPEEVTIDQVRSPSSTLQGLLNQIEMEEDYVNPVLAMDLINLREEFCHEVDLIRANYINSGKETPKSIREILDLDITSKDQIPHALLAISLLHGVSSEQNMIFFDKINKAQYQFSGKYIDKMHISIHIRNKEQKRNLFISVVKNFNLIPSTEDVEYFVQD